jgi:hypothetical protein
MMITNELFKEWMKSEGVKLLIGSIYVAAALGTLLPP